MPDCSCEQLFARVLAERLGLDTYVWLVGFCKEPDTDVSKDEEFQNRFTSFFKIRRDAKWRRCYYDVFEEARRKGPANRDCQSVLEAIASFSNSCELSFASKMLSIIDPGLPIYDSNVTRALKAEGIDVRIKQAGTLEDRLVSACKAYEVLCNECNRLLQTPEGETWVSSYDDVFNYNKQYTAIRPMKKLDYILWCYGTLQ